MKGHHPWTLIVIGLLVTCLFLIVVTTQVETNEAYVAGNNNVDVYHPNWSVLLQVPNLIFGNESQTEAIQTVVGWGTELLFLVFVVVGYEAAHSAVGHSGQIMAALFGLGSVAIVVYNFYTDYQFGTIGTGTGSHLLFAVITSFIVAFFGTLGPALIIKGWKAV